MLNMTFSEKPPELSLQNSLSMEERIITGIQLPSLLEDKGLAGIPSIESKASSFQQEQSPEEPSKVQEAISQNLGRQNSIQKSPGMIFIASFAQAIFDRRVTHEQLSRQRSGAPRRERSQESLLRIVQQMV